jgi:hypothetical protein
MKITKNMLKRLIQEELGGLYELDKDPGPQTHPASGPGMTHPPDPTHMDFGDEPADVVETDMPVEQAVDELMAIRAAHPILKALAVGLKQLGIEN